MAKALSFEVRYKVAIGETSQENLATAISAVRHVLAANLALPSGNYIGDTLFTLPMCYTMARLVARPSGRLVPTAVSNALDQNTFME